MNTTRRSLAAGALALVATAGPLAVTAAHAQDRDRMAARGLATLHHLEAINPRSRYYARHAQAVLVFPSILKAGFVFGAQSGNGVLLIGGRPAGYYNLTGGSWGLQVGAQDFSYVLFFMTPGALHYLRDTAGFSAGTGPSITIINQGGAAVANTQTVGSDVYAFPFNGRGLMADLTLQGTKITRIDPR